MFTKLLKSKRGYVAAGVGTSLIAVLTLSAVVVDLGRIYVTKSQLQNAADSMALAAVVDLVDGTEAATTSAQAYANQHYAAGDALTVAPTDVTYGNLDLFTFNYTAGATPYNAVVVNARRTEGSMDGTMPLLFGSFLGKDTTNVEAVSRAALDNRVHGVKAHSRLIPYTAHHSIFDADGDGNFDLNVEIEMHPEKYSPGNFGFLDLDGGSSGTPELRNFIENGYDKDFVIPPGTSTEVGSILVEGSPGIQGGSVTDSFLSIVDEVVFMPVFNYVTGSGSNTKFNIYTLAAVKIKDVKLTGNQNSRYIKAEVVYFTSSALVTHPVTPTALPRVPPTTLRVPQTMLPSP